MEDTKMFLRAKQSSKKIKYITIRCCESLLYEGKWDELPFDEKIIIEYSVLFYDDPDPCYIHRGAVRIRLLAELEEAFESSQKEASNALWYSMLARYMGVPSVTLTEFSDR